MIFLKVIRNEVCGKASKLDFFAEIIIMNTSLFLPRGGNFRLTKQTNKQL